MGLDNLQLTLVESTGDVFDLLTWLGERREFLAVDVETTGLNAGCDRIRLCQFGDHTRGWALDYGDWRGVVKEVLVQYDRPIVAHNLIYDSKMLKADGIEIPQRLAHCSMVMAFLKDPASAIGLKSAATRYVDRRAAVGQGLLQQAMSGASWTWATVPIDHPAYWQYAALDTCITSLLASKLWSETGGGEFRDTYELELAVIHCLRDAELAGMLTDPDYIQRAIPKLLVELAELKPQIPCNPNSDKQVVELLTGLGAHLFVRTERGNLSVDKSVLGYLEPDYPVAGLIERYRLASRLLGSYLEKFQEVPDGLAVSGVLHANTKPVGARTGRMSVTEPPLQTLPRGRVVRDAIVARPGHRLILADFAGMEMRALASLAQETNMLAAYGRGDDLHDFVAREVYGPSFTKQQRQVCKNAGFAKIYGAGVPKFAVTAGISIDEAESFLARYDVLFPGVGTFMTKVTTAVLERAGGRRNGRGWVKLQDGRKLPVEADKAYVGVNYRIQGGTAISTKRKIVELDSVGLGPAFRLAVHDELIYEVPEEHAAEARHVIERVMPDRRSFPGVTLEIETDEVHRWGERYRGDYPAYVGTELAPWLREGATA